jgi:hypothetical protein
VTVPQNESKLYIPQSLFKNKEQCADKIDTCSPSLAKLAERIEGDTMISSFEYLSTREASTTGIVALPLQSRSMRIWLSRPHLTIEAMSPIPSGRNLKLTLSLTLFLEHQRY